MVQFKRIMYLIRQLNLSILKKKVKSNNLRDIKFK